ncbi:hypothetical protein GGE65_007876 [Skermanella aerolata]|uniref:hypothetical protein n=1 Tax=Skermanella aerolata TaxID=393310 RepID=UPI003D2342BA
MLDIIKREALSRILIPAPCRAALCRRLDILVRTTAPASGLTGLPSAPPGFLRNAIFRRFRRLMAAFLPGFHHCFQTNMAAASSGLAQARSRHLAVNRLDLVTQRKQLILNRFDLPRHAYS